MSDNQERPESIRKKMFAGAAWMVAMRMVSRFIGLISTVILARILMPEDFGIVAMASLSMGLLEVFANFGVDLALIRTENAQVKHYNTAWTFKILQVTIVAILLLAASPWIVTYFHEPRLAAILPLFAFGIFVTGFENIGVVAFRKELDFAKEFKFNVIKRVATVGVTIGCAFTFQNYWALVAGVVTGNVLGVIISFLVHPYRPRLSLEAAGEFWHFSQWMLINNIARFGILRTDEIVIGGFNDSSKLGIYNVGSELAQMPSNEIIMPASSALFPGYAKLQGDIPRLTAAFINVFTVVGLIAMPVASGFLAVSHDFVAVVLGSKWMETVPIIEWITLFSIGLAFVSTCVHLLNALNRVRQVAIWHLIFLSAFVPTLFVVGADNEITTIAMTRTLLFAVFAIGFVILVSRALSLSIFVFAKLVWRPLIASIVMVTAVKFFHIDAITWPIVTLVIDITVGGIIYSSLAFLLWKLAGSPDTAEKLVFELALRKLRLKRN